MTLKELKERLKLLIDGEAIIERAYQIAIQAFKQLQVQLNKKDIEQADMLFTHLPMALTRIEQGENVEGPNSQVMREVRTSEHFPLAEELVTYIEKIWKNELPQEEKDFLYMHFTNIINLNVGGTSK